MSLARYLAREIPSLESEALGEVEGLFDDGEGKVFPFPGGREWRGRVVRSNDLRKFPAFWRGRFWSFVWCEFGVRVKDGSLRF